jgi:hypothetical protein
VEMLVTKDVPVDARNKEGKWRHKT